ncbi:hypothetical protein BLNAU_12390 [Blattamonas nauphoetae]|uniref:Uncharacterized protein n=1 Tax=Blattamonas nauphoetae TaxID=2049346 RepID=A0ABQ9XL31_9EUKA|nr:hypothetical protein BLNAU_12390 [Blattamonas nauphoetae]
MGLLRCLVIGLDIGKERHKMEAERQKMENDREEMKRKEAKRQEEFEKNMEEQNRMMLLMVAERAKNQQMMEQERRWAEQERKRQSKVGAAAIEMFDRMEWTVSGNVFTKSQRSWSSFLSLEFGAVVARLSLTIRKGPKESIVVGIISSNLSTQALTTFFPNLKGGTGWDLNPDARTTNQNGKLKNHGSACLGGRKGQRVVLEADGREGKRTLKLSQDGETQPVFFTNIPVPFRFAVCIYRENDAVEIESVEVVGEPKMVGGAIPVVIDE